jgi:hypothetical protein
MITIKYPDGRTALITRIDGYNCEIETTRPITQADLRIPRIRENMDGGITHETCSKVILPIEMLPSFIQPE